MAAPEHKVLMVRSAAERLRVSNHEAAISSRSPRALGLNVDAAG